LSLLRCLFTSKNDCIGNSENSKNSEIYKTRALMIYLLVNIRPQPRLDTQAAIIYNIYI
jgi:hypothetical protein